MTVETSVENKICKSCGADVRLGALFCYSCGASVAPEMTNGKVSSAKTENGERTATENAIAEPDTEEIVGKRPIEKPFAESINGRTKTAEVKEAGNKNKQSGAEKETVLKTAAVVRRQSKPPQRKNVEVVWEQPQGSLNIWFLITAGVLILFAVGALLAMLYLR
ncbi:MAG: zinc-ribbon domain-containing protein [Pyrinomonadaceae bacterium]